MRILSIHYFLCLFFLCLLNIQLVKSDNPTVRQDRNAGADLVMSKAYLDIWNPDEQARIDRDIEQYRKADALLRLDFLPVGTEVRIEQISHDFIFGASIFNFNQLGSSEMNRKYKELFGTLFNSATIPFYWKTFETEPGRMRFREEYWDTEDFWNHLKEPKSQPHWRRPATDPVVEFCESKGIRLHGHPIAWGNNNAHYPEWLFERYCPQTEKDTINKLGSEGLKNLTSSQIAELAPVYVSEINRLFEKRIHDLARYYKGRIKSWDVVNESASDYPGFCLTGDAVTKSVYGLMPGDYTYHTFSIADKVFPKEVLFNINDYIITDTYLNQVRDLLNHGCRIDIMGSQMHLFDPQQCLDIADGKQIQTPDQVRKTMELLSGAGLPIHLSEITITAPGNDIHGREIQAVIARNLYRLWFSIKPMMGITWWNVVDECGWRGEPTTSGLFTRNMEPKPSFYALDKLINQEWKIHLIMRTDSTGIIKFRGFKGLYRITWKDMSGKESSREFYLKNNGDGTQIVN